MELSDMFVDSYGYLRKPAGMSPGLWVYGTRGENGWLVFRLNSYRRTL